MRDVSISEKKFAQVDDLLWEVITLLTKKKTEILNEFDLTMAQYDILVAICHFSDNKEEIIQINLAEKAHKNPMTTSTILKNLEERKFIKRERGLVNTRTVKVNLTQAGKNFYISVKQRIDEVSAELFKNIHHKHFTSQLLILSDELNKMNN